ncbi:MAG: hypothetical protein FJ034_02495 [Chloroflexi bacterium]|nr:hypothetical protein [Chloroflexota bacterium]
MILGVPPEMLTWIAARATGLASYFALCLAVLSGIALRTSLLDVLATNRALRALHDFMSLIWLPLGAAHVVALLLDKTARIGIDDLFVPFQTEYGQLAIGLGTISLDLVVLIGLTSLLRDRMNLKVWRWIHRLSYPMFVVTFLHAVWSGTDFAAPIVSSISWAIAGGIALLGVSRIVFGRLPD